MNVTDTEIWITGHAHDCFHVLAAIFGGGERGQTVAGNLALAIFVVFTMLSTRFVLREGYGVAVQVYDIGITVLKIILGLALVIFLGIWTVRIYRFVYPGQSLMPAADHMQAAETMATQAMKEGKESIWKWAWAKLNVTSV